MQNIIECFRWPSSVTRINLDQLDSDWCSVAHCRPYYDNHGNVS